MRDSPWGNLQACQVTAVTHATGGVEAGDYIVAVNGISVLAMPWDRVVELLVEVTCCSALAALAFARSDRSFTNAAHLSFPGHAVCDPLPVPSAT